VRHNDPEVVAREYASEQGLLGRRAAYRFAEGPDPREIVFRAVAEVEPRRVLEVGPGPGELAERIRDELEADVVAVDSSPRMVELTRGRGIEAMVGDVQELPFEDESFDCAVAAWMLYHVPDVDRALAELARVLRPGGRLVAVTNSRDHLAELWQLVGGRRMESSFTRENGEEQLLRHFPSVERRDVATRAVFPDRKTIVDYVSTLAGADVAGRVPELGGPFEAHGVTAVFLADHPVPGTGGSPLQIPRST